MAEYFLQGPPFEEPMVRNGDVSPPWRIWLLELRVLLDLGTGNAGNVVVIGSEGSVGDSGHAGASSDYVGISDTQTLTNKTIDADSNTISNIEHGAECDNPSSGVHGVTGSVVGTTDTQTLTNKTFGVPTLDAHPATKKYADDYFRYAFMIGEI